MFSRTCSKDCTLSFGLCVPIFKTRSTQHIHPSIPGFIELVFQSPLSIEMFTMSMGSVAGPVRRCQGVDCRASEIVDDDFDYVLDDAELQIGRKLNTDVIPGANGFETGACTNY